MNIDTLKITYNILSNKGIKARAALFYVRLVAAKNGHGCVVEQLSVLGEQNGVHERTIRRWLIILRKAGYIRIQAGNPNYTLEVL